MAMMVINVAEPKEGSFSSSKGLKELLFDSISGFVEGRLPGDLGDTPEALETGKGAGEVQLCLRLPEVLERAQHVIIVCLHVHCACMGGACRFQPSACPSAVLSHELSKVFCVCAGCVQRASCLLLYVYLVGHHYITGSRLSLPWKVFCKAVPIDKVMSLFDPMLYVSGAAGPMLCPATSAAFVMGCNFNPGTPDCPLQGMPNSTRPLATIRLTLWSLHCCWCA